MEGPLAEATKLLATVLGRDLEETADGVLRIARRVAKDLVMGFNPTRFQTEPPACYRASWQRPGPDSHWQATSNDASYSPWMSPRTPKTLG